MKLADYVTARSALNNISDETPVGEDLTVYCTIRLRGGEVLTHHEVRSVFPRSTLAELAGLDGLPVYVSVKDIISIRMTEAPPKGTPNEIADIVEEDEEISAIAAGDSATGAHEQAENAPNATLERLIYWVLCESEWGTTLDHFTTETEQLEKVAEHLRLFWTRDREDEAIPADMQEAVEKLTEMGDSKLHSLRWESVTVPA